MSSDNHERIVMISGSNRGIGKAIREKLAQEGYRLSLGVRRPEELQDMESEGVLVCQYDAYNDQSARDWVSKTIDRFGRIDALINNAGILRTAWFEDNEETDQALEDLWKVNVRAPFHLIRCTLPHLKKGKQSKVITIASLSGKRVPTVSVGYSMSKHAVLALTHGVRLLCWEDGVRATAICPGYTNTEMVSHVTAIEKQNMTQPEDVAKMVSSVLSLPNNASVSELYINCRAESQY